MISSHTLHAGSDSQNAAGLPLGLDFNPRSSRGERHYIDQAYGGLSEFQFTLPLQGATACGRKGDASIVISIHAPLAGSDCRRDLENTSSPDFNPRSPCGERPYWRVRCFILSLFQSTPPMRGATVRMLIEDILTLISIHAPLAGSDGADIVDINIARHISTHAPHAGSDTNFFQQGPRHLDFNPRSPCGERP